MLLRPEIGGRREHLSTVGSMQHVLCGQYFVGPASNNPCFQVILRFYFSVDKLVVAPTWVTLRFIKSILQADHFFFLTGHQLLHNQHLGRYG